MREGDENEWRMIMKRGGGGGGGEEFDWVYMQIDYLWKLIHWQMQSLMIVMWFILSVQVGKCEEWGESCCLSVFIHWWFNKTVYNTPLDNVKSYSVTVTESLHFDWGRRLIFLFGLYKKYAECSSISSTFALSYWTQRDLQLRCTWRDSEWRHTGIVIWFLHFAWNR